MTTNNHVLFIDKEGGNFLGRVYDNPLQRIIGSLFKRAIGFFDVSLGDDVQCTIVDYGTADGTHFLRILPLLLETFRKKVGEKRDMMCIMDDLPSNDFKSVWKNVRDLRNLSHTYFATTTGSFYEQCFPRNSVHVGVTSISTHWLADNIVAKDSLCLNSTKDPLIKEKLEQITARDWEKFLLLRCEELVKGGILICLEFGIEDDVSSSVWMQSEFGPLNKAWEELHNNAVISQDEFERSGFPFLIRTQEQHKKPFVNQESLVYKAGLRLMHFESIFMSYLEKDRDIFKGNITADNEKDVLQMIAQKRTDCLRALYSSQLYKALNPQRPECEQQEIVKLFFENYYNNIAENKAWLEFPDDVCQHVMIIRKE